MRISVIIPTYRRAELALRAVRSALAQEGDAGLFEVIVSDDGSGDGTPETLESELAPFVKAGRLRVLHGPRRGDPGAARNRAAREARGEWLAFLDSDDEWEAGRLGALALDGCDFAFEAARPVEGDPARALLAMNVAITSSVLIRREWFERLGGFPEGYFPYVRQVAFPGWEDYELWLRAVFAGARVRLLRPGAVRRVQSPGGAGDISLRPQMWRELSTLLRLTSRVPTRLRGLWARRMLGAIKGGLVG